MGKERILIIEDEPGMRLAMDRVLRSFGYTVATAGDGEEALGIFRKQPADLVIADLYLQEKDGIETIVELMKEVPAPKIIAISGHRARDLMLHSAERLGAVEIMHKPFTAESLLAVVESALGKSHPTGPKYLRSSTGTARRPSLRPGSQH